MRLSLGVARQASFWGILSLAAVAAGAPQSPSTAGPRPPPKVAGIVIFDLTVEADDPDATQVLTFRGDQAGVGQTVACTALPPPSSQTAPPLTQLHGLLRCATDPVQSIRVRATAAAAALATARANVGRGNSRFISAKGDRVLTIAIDAVTLFKMPGGQPFIARGPTPDAAFDEKARTMQILSDLKSLARIAGGIIGAALESPAAAKFDPASVETENGVWAHSFDHALQLTRATLTVSASGGTRLVPIAFATAFDVDSAQDFLDEWDALQVAKVPCTSDGLPARPGDRRFVLNVLVCSARSEGEPSVRVKAIEGLGRVGDQRAIPELFNLTRPTEMPQIRQAALTALSQIRQTGPLPPDITDPEKPVAVVATGPMEHWFISADVPLTTGTRLKLNNETGIPELVDAPASFYFGVNFLLGDLLDSNRPFWQNLVLKAVVEASAHPLDSVGFAVGLRGQYFTRFGLNLDLLTPFAGVTWNVVDEEQDGVIRINAKRTPAYLIGLSVNLDQALKWVGGK